MTPPMKPLNLAGPVKLIQLLIVVDDPKEGIFIAQMTMQKSQHDFRIVTREDDFRGLDPARLVIVRGFVSQGLFDATEFFRQMGATILDINYKELKRDQ